MKLYEFEYFDNQSLDEKQLKQRVEKFLETECFEQGWVTSPHQNLLKLFSNENILKKASLWRMSERNFHAQNSRLKDYLKNMTSL